MRAVSKHPLIVLALFASSLAAQAAGSSAPAGAKATLTVEYIYESSGKKQDKIDVHEWRVRRSANLVANLTAMAPTSLPSMQELDAKQTAELKNKQTKAKSAATKMAPMMQSVEQIMAKCGEDEACISREVEAMGKGMAGTPQMDAAMSAGKDINEISKQGPLRYQAWHSTSQSGTYSIDETTHIVHGDPICIGLPRDRCTRDEVRKGSGAIPLPPGAKNAQALAGASAFEVDMEKNTVTLLLPQAMLPLPYIETITTDEPEGTHDVPTPKGPQKKQRMLASSESSNALGKPMTVAINGSWRNQSGEKVMPVKGQFGEGGTLTIRWKLAAQ